MKQSMKMEPKKNNVIAILLGGVTISGLFLLSACGDDGGKTAGGTEEDAGIIAITDKMVSGVSQKGPFANGSSVTVYELDGKTLAQTGSSFEGKIKNDLGEFSVKVVSLASQYALLKANGFYRNEITGEKSNSQITLYALTDLSDRDEVNVNLLTHLAYERSLFLATEDSLLVAKAKKQAEAEVFQSFGIEGVADAAEDLNIFGESDQSAALLAVSILMQGNLKEADFSERLNDYAQDIEADGVWDDAVTATQVADWAAEQGLGAGLVSIRGNVQAWNSLAGVPDFEKYVNNFWYQNYGLGTCDKKREGEVKKNQNATSVRANEYFICKSGAWVVANDLEKDTYKWEAGKDADVKNGDVVAANCYVFEDKAWRTGNENDCSLNLRGCTKLRQDTVGQGVDKAWYTCDDRSWREATNIEKDTATWGAGKFDGEVRAGQVNKDIYYTYDMKGETWRNATMIEEDTYDYEKNKPLDCTKDGAVRSGVHTKKKYVCDKDTFRLASSLEDSVGLGCVSYNQNDYIMPSYLYSYYKCNNSEWEVAIDKLNLGSVIDERDGHEYETVGIGTQVWMRENLNYEGAECRSIGLNGEPIYPEECSICPNKELNQCSVYGRLYAYGRVPSEICPDGWHTPSSEEWNSAIAFLGKYNVDCEMNGYRYSCTGGEFSLAVFDAYFSDNILGGEFYTERQDDWQPNGDHVEREVYVYSGLDRIGRFVTFYGQDRRYVILSTGNPKSKISVFFDILVDYESTSVRCVKDAE